MNILENIHNSQSFFIGENNENIIDEMLKNKNDSEIVK